MRRRRVDRSSGDFIQQGFATNEVYKYENEIEWKDGAPADVSYFTVSDLGFDNYPADDDDAAADRLDGARRLPRSCSCR